MLGMLLGLAGTIVWVIARAAKRFDEAYAAGPAGPLATGAQFDAPSDVSAN